MSAQAALLISQAVKAGSEAEFTAWEAEIAAAARKFEGFQGMEIFAPVPGVQEDYVILVRFESAERLKGWLEADIRKALIEKGQKHFAKPPTMMTMAAPQTSDHAPVAAVINSVVPPERVDAFRQMQQAMELEEKKFPGYLGTECFPPVEGVTKDWTILFRFDNDEHMEAWLQSDTRKKILSESDFKSYSLKKIGSSFGGWFPPNTPDTPLPPDWMMSLVVLMALYPSVFTTFHFTATFASAWPLPRVMLLNNIVSTILLTWVGMPIVNKWMKWWLYPKKSDPPSNLPLGVAVICVYLFCALQLFMFIEHSVFGA